MSAPASAWTFVRRNPGRVVPVALVLALSTFLLASLLPLVRSLKENLYRNVEVFRGAVFVTEANRAAFEGLREEDLGALPGVAACWRLTYFKIDMELFIGSMELSVVGLPPDGIEALLGRHGMEVGAGRMPSPGAAELAVSGDILRAHGWRLGDRVEGLRLVGRLDGPARLGVYPVDAVASPEASADFKRGFLVLPERGREEEAAAALRGRLGIAAGDVTRWGDIEREIEASTRNLDVLTAVIVLGVAAVIALVVGLIQRIYFLQRTREFGILWACGLSRRSLLLRALGEGVILTVGACGVGYGLAAAGLRLFRLVYLDAHGLVVSSTDPVAAAATGLLVVGALAASVGGTARRLHRFDPVRVVDEGGN